MTLTLTLHGYWRSTASYRVRIALNLKGVGYDQVTHDLRTGAQRDKVYFQIAPQGLVPALETIAGPLTQSMAILEYIEERWPQPGFRALETIVRTHGGKFAFGDQPSLADCALVPQVYSTERFGVDLSRFIHLRNVTRAALELEPVLAAHPSQQPGADPS